MKSSIVLAVLSAYCMSGADAAKVKFETFEKKDGLTCETLGDATPKSTMEYEQDKCIADAPGSFKFIDGGRQNYPSLECPASGYKVTAYPADGETACFQFDKAVTASFTKTEVKFYKYLEPADAAKPCDTLGDELETKTITVDECGTVKDNELYYKFTAEGLERYPEADCKLADLTPYGCNELTDEIVNFVKVDETDAPTGSPTSKDNPKAPTGSPTTPKNNSKAPTTSPTVSAATQSSSSIASVALAVVGAVAALR